MLKTLQSPIIDESEDPKKPVEFGAKAAFQKLTAVEDWFGLGWFLQIEDKVLEEIEGEYARNDDRKLAMLQYWEKTNPKASWSQLAEALKKMPQHQSLSEDIASH